MSFWSLFWFRNFSCRLHGSMFQNVVSNQQQRTFPRRVEMMVKVSGSLLRSMWFFFLPLSPDPIIVWTQEPGNELCWLRSLCSSHPRTAGWNPLLPGTCGHLRSGPASKSSFFLCVFGYGYKHVGVSLVAWLNLGGKFLARERYQKEASSWTFSSI